MTDYLSFHATAPWSDPSPPSGKIQIQYKPTPQAEIDRCLECTAISCQGSDNCPYLHGRTPVDYGSRVKAAGLKIKDVQEALGWSDCTWYKRTANPTAAQHREILAAIDRLSHKGPCDSCGIREYCRGICGKLRAYLEVQT